MEDRRLSLERQQFSAVEPLLSLAHLAVSADEKGIVLTGRLGLVSVIADQPLPSAEDDEVVGVRMDVPASWIVGEPFGRLLAEEPRVPSATNSHFRNGIEVPEPRRSTRSQADSR